MRLADEIYLIELFKASAAAKRREDRMAEEMYRVIDARRDEERRKEKEDEVVAEIAAATKEQIVAFRERLDAYDTATVDALTAAELMSLPDDEQIIHIAGVGFIRAKKIRQNEIAPYCFDLADNPLEGGRLPPHPKVRLATPDTGRTDRRKTQETIR